jgi:hypothetical protein
MQLILEKKITYKALRYCLEILNQKNASPTFSHGEGSWGKSLTITINGLIIEGITPKNLTKKTPLVKRMDGPINYNK